MAVLDDSRSVTRIAVWSGPRNISTAMMRSWSSRSDTTVSDEPLYAHYLSTLPVHHRNSHPGADRVLESQPVRWRTVVTTLTGRCDTPIWYQKHMAHHLTPEMETEMDAHPEGWRWIESMSNAFLIRDPAEMLTSFIKVIPNPTPHDLGLPQQVRLFDRLCERSTDQASAPPVFSARDILVDPRRGLQSLCMALGVPFDSAMLSWNPGPHPADGVWAQHWYARVHASTGFSAYHPKSENVPARLTGVLKECQRLYDHLAAFRTLA